MTEQGNLIPTHPGLRLRETRRSRGLTLSHVAQQLRIRESLLRAIERGETESLSPVYLRGYIRSYARFLDVDVPEDELSRVVAPPTEPELRSVFTIPAAKQGSDRWLKATSYVVASVLIAALAWQFTHQAVRFSQGEQSDPMVESSSGSPSKQIEVDPGSQGRDSRNTHISASIAAMEVLHKGRKSAGEQAWAALSAPSAEPEPILPEGHRSLRIAASADSWVEILDASDRYLEMDLVRGGDERAYQGLPPFRILIGRASSVDLELDGEKIDLAPHTRGNVARLTLEAETVADAQATLQGDTD